VKNTTVWIQNVVRTLEAPPHVAEGFRHCDPDFFAKSRGTTATELNGRGALPPPCLFLADLREHRVRRLL
jgi:hypothetical protein